MRNTVLAVLAIAMTMTACNSSSNSSATMETQLDTVSYAMGYLVSKGNQGEGWEDLNPAVMAQAMRDYYENGDEGSEMTEEEAKNILGKYNESIKAGAGLKWLEDNKTKEGVVTLPSGLQYKVITEGTGEKASFADTVECHYTGKLIDGKVFDSSVERGESIKFPVNRVIPGWTEAMTMMPKGSKWELYIPYNLGYGPQGSPPVIPGYSTLIFEVELLDVIRASAESNIAE